MTEPQVPASDDPSKEQAPKAKDGFWRKRIGRFAILAGLLLGATQLLPAVPEDQFLEIRAPQGGRLSQVEVTYYSGDDPVAGSQIRPTSPAAQVPHKVHLPSGEYSVAIKAEGIQENGEAGSWSTRKTVSLDGSTEAIQLVP